MGGGEAADRGCGALRAVHRLLPKVLQPPTPFQVGLAASHPGFHCAEEALDDIHLCAKSRRKAEAQMNLQRKKQTQRLRANSWLVGGRGQEIGGVWDEFYCCIQNG